MACTMDENLTQQVAVAGFVDRVAIGMLVFIGDESVAFGVHAQHRNMNVAVEDDVLFQKFNRRRVGADPSGFVQGCPDRLQDQGQRRATGPITSALLG